MCDSYGSMYIVQWLNLAMFWALLVNWKTKYVTISRYEYDIVVITLVQGKAEDKC